MIDLCYGLRNNKNFLLFGRIWGKYFLMPRIISLQLRLAFINGQTPFITTLVNP